MDLRVLAAVFLTLFAVAVGMAQGEIQMTDLQDTAEGLPTSTGLLDILSQAGTQVANTTVTGTITSSAATELQVHGRSRLAMQLGPTATVYAGDSTLQPGGNASIVVKGFRGTVSIGATNTTVTGSVNSISTPALDLTYPSPREFSATVATADIAFRGLSRESITVENATGTVTADETTIKVEGETATFKGFTGNLSVTGDQYEVSGAVRSAMLGDVEVS